MKEDVPLAILEEFNINLYSDVYWGNDGHNPLHSAAKWGCTKLVKFVLDRGFIKLLTYSYKEGQLLVEVALEHGRYGTAAVMLRAMND